MKLIAVAMLVGCAGTAAPRPATPPIAPVRHDRLVFASLTGTGGVPARFDTSRADKTIIQRQVGRRMMNIWACYDHVRATRPDLEGKVLVEMVITGTTGRVASVTASGLDDELDRCIETELLQIEFPKTDTGGDVTVHALPLSFRK